MFAGIRLHGELDDAGRGKLLLGDSIDGLGNSSSTTILAYLRDLEGECTQLKRS
jgi:hypothetical protein